MAKLQIKDTNGNFIKLDENNIGMFLITEKKTIQIEQIDKYQSKRFSENVLKEGYTAIGVIGFNPSGTNAGELVITGCRMFKNNLQIVFKNTSDVVISNVAEELDILYKAN